MRRKDHPGAAVWPRPARRINYGRINYGRINYGRINYE
jgi:hypothetical protein